MSVVLAYVCQPCLFCGQAEILQLDPGLYARWDGGEFVQDVWPDWTPAQREPAHHRHAPRVLGGQLRHRGGPMIGYFYIVNGALWLSVFEGNDILVWDVVADLNEGMYL